MRAVLTALTLASLLVLALPSASTAANLSVPYYPMHEAICAIKSPPDGTVVLRLQLQ